MIEQKDWQTKLKLVPQKAGVYYHLDEEGVVIYVGKAVNLRRRLASYAVSKVGSTNKDRQLQQQIVDFKYSETENGFQALLLESEMICRHRPKFNILQRNSLDYNWFYLLFEDQSTNPNLQLKRNLQEIRTKNYLGPYLESRVLKDILKFLRKSFPYSIHRQPPKKPCLDYHLGLCPCPAANDFSPQEALANLRKIKLYLAGEHRALEKKLQKEMKSYALKYQYEQAALIRNQLKALKNFRQSLIFQELKHFKPKDDQALVDLKELFCLRQLPERIEAYDISHLSGQYVTASMVVAQSGMIMPHLKRRFKAKIDENNDFAQMQAVIARRLQSKTLPDLPDLLLIDGGKGQVSGVLEVLNGYRKKATVLGLAKKDEEIILRKGNYQLNEKKLRALAGLKIESSHFCQLKISPQTDLVKFLQRLRDASHRFALAYQRQLHYRAQTDSPLLSLPGVGPATYKKLMKVFGSMANLQKSSQAELQEILNHKQAKVVYNYLQLDRR